MTNAIQQSSKMARAGDMRGAQAMAKCWGKKMKANITTEEQVMNYHQFSEAMNPAYKMIQQTNTAQRIEDMQNCEEEGEE